MTKFSNKHKKNIFDPFSQFWRAKKFFQKIQLSYITSYGFLAQCQNLEKPNNPTARKQPDRLKDEHKDGHTLFYMTILSKLN